MLMKYTFIWEFVFEYEHIQYIICKVMLKILFC